jgi:hypothetical protein
MLLEDHIAEIRSKLIAGAFPNEASVSGGVVVRLLQSLEWPVFDPQVVYPEFSVNGGRVDYALCHPAKKPLVFVEVKPVGGSGGAERQLFEYAFHLGVPMAVLTDGQEWHFFLPGEQGPYEERRVYKLDMLERDIDECNRVFRRYLGYDDVCSGQAIRNARKDYEDVAKRREISATFSKAWDRILVEPDELLVELLCEKVENLCGYRPEFADAAKYLKETVRSRPSPVPPVKMPDKLQPPPPPPPTARHNYVLFTETRVARNAMQLVIDVFEELASRDSAFLERFAAVAKHGRIRRYLARRREELYPDRPDLSRYAKQLRGGWWIGTNFANREKRRMLEIACEVAEIKFGSDLRIYF